MRHGSLGPTMIVQRTGKHGRRRGKRLGIRQLKERAHSHRQMMQRMMVRLGTDTGEWPRVQNFTHPVGPDRKVIR